MADSIESVAIFGTGLIGASVGLALRARGFPGAILGWDRSSDEAELARLRGAIDVVAQDPLAAAAVSNCIVLAMPVFGILNWIDRLGAVLRPGQLVTDVGSTKQAICERAAKAFSSSEGAYFLPGHPMAGKEVHGAAYADGELFRGAVWLFTPLEPENRPVAETSLLAANLWRHWVERFGTRTLDLDSRRHDEICAWASHLPQMLGTALAALLEDTFPEDASSGGGRNLSSSAGQLRAIGGRAMHEMTRLGASPFSMWRDIAQTNDEAIAEALLALEQRLAYLRESLKQPELRDEFQRANRFRSRF